MMVKFVDVACLGIHLNINKTIILYRVNLYKNTRACISVLKKPCSLKLLIEYLNNFS